MSYTPTYVPPYSIWTSAFVNNELNKIAAAIAASNGSTPQIVTANCTPGVDVPNNIAVDISGLAGGGTILISLQNPPAGNDTVTVELLQDCITSGSTTKVLVAPVGGNFNGISAGSCFDFLWKAGEVRKFTYVGGTIGWLSVGGGDTAYVEAVGSVGYLSSVTTFLPPNRDYFLNGSSGANRNVTVAAVAGQSIGICAIGSSNMAVAVKSIFNRDTFNGVDVTGGGNYLINCPGFARCFVKGSIAAYTYVNGVSGGIGATLTAGANGVFVADGVTPVVGDGVLFQAFGDTAPTSYGAGLYTLTTAGNVSTKAVFTRAPNFDTSDKLGGGVVVVGQEGATYKNEVFAIGYPGGIDTGSATPSFTSRRSVQNNPLRKLVAGAVNGSGSWDWIVT